MIISELMEMLDERYKDFDAKRKIETNPVKVHEYLSRQNELLELKIEILNKFGIEL